MTTATIRVRRLPLYPGLAGGALSGFVAGLFAGCVLGGLLAWFAGAVLDWHRQLGFTLGVTEELLPLGDQVGLLESVRDLWWLVVPVTGVSLGLLNGLIGLLAGGLAVGAFNRSAHGVLLEVELVERVVEEAAPDGAAPAEAEEPAEPEARPGRVAGARRAPPQ